jgi:metallophosphoesterase (TIGR00282 family)
MKEIDCPFRKADEELARLREKTPIIFVDFHAEATSEKQALAYYLDGRVSAVIGTHTHVQTADEKVLSGGTAYLTDAGMTGPHDSVLWTKPEIAIARFMSGIPHKFEMADGDVRMSGCVVEIDEQSGRALSIERFQCVYDGRQSVREYFGLPPREAGEQEPRSVPPNDA